MKRLFLLASVVALTLASAGTALAEMGTIYGPVYIVKREHSEKQTKLHFKAPVAGSGIIVINNGGGAKSFRVSSATIELNDVKVARQKDFNKEVDTLRYNVTLKEDNELEVRVDSCKECQLEITVLGEIPAPPPAPPAAPAPPAPPPATPAPPAPPM